MILLNIETIDKSQADHIVKVLLSENLILSAVIIQVSKTHSNSDGSISSSMAYLIEGKTKALLFDTIEKLLNEKFRDPVPEIYATPIVQRDWEQGNLLRDNTPKV